MLQCEFLDEYGINVIVAHEPFALEELFDLLQSGEDGEEGDLRPTLMDLRGVTPERISATEILLHVEMKRNVDRARTTIPCAYLVRSDAAFAVVRMANVLAELAGVTPEECTFITEDRAEALAWLEAVGCETRARRVH